MPATKLDPKFKAKRFDKLIKQKMIELDLTHQSVAKALGMSYQVYWTKRNSGSWKFNDLFIIFNFLKFTDEEKLKVFKEQED